MIRYRKGYWGLLIACRVVGTSWPYGIIPGLISAAVGVILNQVPDVQRLIENDDEFLPNHYPFQLLAYLVGFFMVFRTNFAYRRYWLALDAVQRMSAKWLDGASMAVAFDAPGDKNGVYLMNSVDGASGANATDSADAACGPSGTSHSEYFAQSVHLFSLMHALALQHLRGDLDLRNLQDAVSEGGPRQMTPVRRISASYPVDCIFARYSANAVEKIHRAKKMKVLGSLSEEEIKVLSIDHLGKDLLGEARVAMVSSWITRRLIARQKFEPMGDTMNTSPPILSRMYQVLSDGMLAFSQACAVALVPFPFPYHNLMQVFLWIYAFTVPVVVNAKIDSEWFRILVNFAAVWSYFSLSAVGDNLEDPYLPYDPNELPLTTMQHTYNAQLLGTGVVPVKPRMPQPAPFSIDQ